MDYFGAGDGYRAVNTMQPAFQPSGNFPATGATDLRYADPGAATTLPAQTQTTIGDLLTGKGVDWAWYATDWDAATVDGTAPAGSTHTVIYAPSGPRQGPDFQTHHHPYNFYAAFDPTTHATARSAHLKDYNDLLSDIGAGTVPPVAWYKPTGNLNQHPGLRQHRRRRQPHRRPRRQAAGGAAVEAHGHHRDLRRVRRAVGPRRRAQGRSARPR